MNSALPDLQVFLASDFSQAEVRVLAEASGDRLLISQFNSGADIHSVIGSTLTGWSVERIKTEKSTRKLTKNMVFGIIYGLGRENLFPYVVAKIRAQDGENADLTGITKTKLVKLYDKFFKTYNGVRVFMEQMTSDAEKRGYVETMFGFRRWVFKNDESRRTFWANQAKNCVDYETEILTKRGWLKPTALNQTDCCLTETGWQRPADIKRWPDYDGPVHVWKSRDFSAVSTPDHRWKVYNVAAGEDQILTSEGIPKHSGYRIHRTIPEISTKESYSDDFVRLCGWVLTDGSFKTCNKTAVTIFQSKLDTKKEIQALMDRLGIASNSKKECRSWYIGGARGKLLRSLFPRKLLSEGFISSLSRRQAAILMETMLKGDGTDNRMTCGDCMTKGFATGREKADMFQMLCSWAGKATTVQMRVQKHPALIKKTGQFVTSTKPCYIIRVKKRDKAQVFPAQETIEKGNGVWCPFFPNDAAWVARREGTVYITKNTPIQSAAHTLLLIALAMINMKPRTYNLLQTPLMEVHDALYFRVRLGDLPGAFSQCQQLLQQGVFEYALRHFKLKFRVPFLSEASAGFCMGSMIPFEGEPLEEFLDKWRAKQKEVESKSWADLVPKFES